MPVVSGRRSIVKDVALMTLTARAVHLSARQEQTVVGLGAHSAFDRFVIARPACTAVKFCFTAIERQVTSGTMEGAFTLFVV